MNTRALPLLLAALAAGAGEEKSDLDRLREATRYDDAKRWFALEVSRSVVTETRRRIRFDKEAVTRALLAHRGGREWDAAPMEYEDGTTFVAESLDARGEVIDTEVLRIRKEKPPEFLLFGRDGRRGDTFAQPNDPPGGPSPGNVPRVCLGCHLGEGYFDPMMSFPKEPEERRVVLDNTSLAVKRVLRGTDREETEAFHGFRGGDPFPADFCAPGKGCEKGSVEGGVAFVRDNVFRPMPEVASLEDLDAAILRELVEDEAERHLPDGRTVAGARRAEREHLRPLPAHEPEACRVLSRVADKFGHVRVDHVHDSLPIVHAYRPATVKLFHDRVEIAVGAERVAVHARRFEKGAKVLEARHVLSLLERKPRAVGEATAIRQWRPPAVFLELRQELAGRTRRPDREWVSILRLLEEHPEEAVEAAVKEAIEKGSPRKETVLALLRRSAEGASPAVAPAAVARPDLAAIEVQAPMLGAYDALAEGVR